MKKAQLVGKIAYKANINKAEAQAALDSMVSSILTALKDGDTVALVGFGTFESRARAARSGRNPRTGESIQITSTNAPIFRAGKGLKDAIN